MTAGTALRPRLSAGWRRIVAARDLWLGVAAITLLGGVLRFATLDLQSFWLDEAFTVHALRRPLPTTVHDILHTQAQPPPYFMLAWAWVRVFGDGEVGLRSLSALFGTATIPVAWAVGRSVINQRAGLLLALFVALAPPLIWYSQEGRAYALVIFLGALSLLFFVRALGVPRRLDLWLWAAASFAAVASHYFALFVVLPEAAWLAWRLIDRRRDWPPFAALAGGLLLLAPIVLFQREHGGADWIGLIDLPGRLRYAAAFAVGGQIVPAPFGTEWWFAGLVAALFATAAIVALRRTAGAARRRTLAVLAVGLGGLALPLLAAALGSDFILDRNLLPLWLPLVTIAAVGIAVAPRPAAIAAAVVVAGWFVYMDVRVFTDERLQREDFREISAKIGPATTDRVISSDPWWSLDPLRLYTTPIENFDAPRPVSVVITITNIGFVPYGEPRSTRVPGPPFRETRRFHEGHWRIIEYTAPGPVVVDPAALTGVGRARAVPFFQPAR